MKNNRRCCVTLILLAAGGLALMLIAGLVYYFYIGPKILDQKRLLASPPIVIVHAPLHGDSAPEGSILQASATASGSNPIAEVELWLDGKLYGQQLPDLSLLEGLTTFHANFSIKMTEGTHMLYWRATDSKGLIGQSSPIAIIGTARLGGGETTIVVAEEGQSLQDIAESLGGEPGVLDELNPGLGTGGLPAGTQVTVPAPPQQDGGQPQLAPPFPGTPPDIIDQVEPKPAPQSGMAVLKPAKPLIDLGSLISVFISNLPAAPAILHVGFDNCVVQLVWYDNADNEQNYNVWMQAGGGPPTNIATLEARRATGLVSYDFNSPAYGEYRFWVEAVNGMGSQPSEVVQLSIDDPTCREMIATRLEIEALDMQTSEGYSNVYCYVSIENIPEKRIPEGKEFIQLVAGATRTERDITKYWGGEKMILIPMPADEEVTLEGKCLALQGTTPISLGTFSESVPRSKWDGSRLEARGTSFVIGYRILPHGSEKAQGSYTYTDFDLLTPTVVSVEAQTAKDPLERSRLARNVTLKWGWGGNPQDITSFVIAMDEEMEFRWANKTDRETSFVLPSSCGKVYKFAVAAVASGGARSGYSTWYEYRQLPCDMYAEVVFDTFVLTSHDDEELGDCDNAELGFEISVASVNRVWRNWDGGLRWHYYGTDTDCNQIYHFTQYPFNKGSPGKLDSFTVLIEPTTSAVDIYVNFDDLDSFIVPWDVDTICAYNKQLQTPYENWATYYEDFSETCQEAEHGERDGTVQINYRVRGYRTPRGP